MHLCAGAGGQRLLPRLRGNSAQIDGRIKLSVGSGQRTVTIVLSAMGQEENHPDVNALLTTPQWSLDVLRPRRSRTNGAHFDA
jgi:hypothetical protein